jgi:hypothetical protein
MELELGMDRSRLGCGLYVLMMLHDMTWLDHKGWCWSGWYHSWIGFVSYLMSTVSVVVDSVIKLLCYITTDLVKKVMF